MWLHQLVILQRREQIAAFVLERGSASLDELAGQFDVSKMTIRRDLHALEQGGVLRRVMGGAIPVVSRFHEPPMSERSLVGLPAKRAIGAAAAALVEDGETIIVDVGTTALECARALSRSQRLTVVTPSLQVAQELSHAPAIRTMVIGGRLRPGEMSLVGSWAEDALGELNCDVLFLGVGGVDPERGLTEYNFDDSRVKQAAIRSAGRCVLLADESKLGRVTFARVAPVSAVSVLVTDAVPDHPVVRALRDEGIKTVHVDPIDQESR